MIQTTLEVIRKHTESYEVIYHSGSGLGIREDGSEVSLTETDYYHMVYQAADVRYLYTVDDGITGQPAIILVVPLEESSLKNILLFYSVDNFKKINDTMGHAFGDEVLRAFDNQIGAVFRVTDIIGRTGGDEFTIFLKFLKDDTNTLREAEKLIQFFKDFTTGEYVKYSPTASIGAAVFPTHGTDFDSRYKATDKALYKAKQRGKNQLAFYDDRDRAVKEE